MELVPLPLLPLAPVLTPVLVTFVPDPDSLDVLSTEPEPDAVTDPVALAMAARTASELAEPNIVDD